MHKDLKSALIFSLLVLASFGAEMGCSTISAVNKTAVAVATSPALAPLTNAAVNTEISDLTKTPDMVYQVEKGDSLWSISVKLYGTGFMWPAIALTNKAVVIDNDCLQVGSALYYFSKISDQAQVAAKVTAYATTPYISHVCKL